MKSSARPASNAARKKTLGPTSDTRDPFDVPDEGQGEGLPDPPRTRPVFRVLAVVIGILILAVGVWRLVEGPFNGRLVAEVLPHLLVGILFITAGITGEWLRSVPS